MFIACNALESGKPIYGRNCFPTAVPFDVRKASRLPASSRLNFGLRPGFGAQPKIRCANRRKRGALPHIRRHSRIPLAELFRQTHHWYRVGDHDNSRFLMITEMIAENTVPKRANPTDTPRNAFMWLASPSCCIV